MEESHRLSPECREGRSLLLWWDSDSTPTHKSKTGAPTPCGGNAGFPIPSRCPRA